VSDINKCFQDGGVKPQLILCNGNNSASATGKPSAATTRNPSATGTQESTQSKGAAPGYMAPQSVSKVGLGMLAVLFVSAAIGTLL
jgi:hypothetical protein